jgi:hypothetical protein
MADHPGHGGFPLAVYGDEAKFNDLGDKFLALALQSPLIRKGLGFEMTPNLLLIKIIFLRLYNPDSFP